MKHGRLLAKNISMVAVRPRDPNAAGGAGSNSSIWSSIWDELFDEGIMEKGVEKFEGKHKGVYTVPHP